MTKIALEQGLHLPGTLSIEPSSKGVIVSIISPTLIRVLRDNRKNVTTYHKKFWMLDEKEMKGDKL